MNLRRIAVLYARELRASAGNFLMIFALVVPVVFSLLINLVFGELYSGKPVLGFYDPENSQFTQSMMAQTHLKSTRYDSLDKMISDVDLGAIETGYVVPQGFDQALKDGSQIDFTVYAWGEASLNSRLITDTTIANVISQVAGLPQTAQVVLHPLGPAEQDSLADKLLPLLILMSIMLGGVMVPALSMIGEKQNRTLLALNVTPAHLSEVFAAKTLLGVTMGSATGLVTLVLNGAFGGRPLLLVTVMLLGVRMLIAEIVPAFKGIADKVVPGAIPALDCPVIFNYAPNALIIGFVVAMITSTITIILTAGMFPSVIIPLTFTCFFEIGTAAIIGNGTGGIRGAVVGAAVSGIIMVFLVGLGSYFFSNTINNWMLVYGGQDFSLWGIVTGLIARIIG